MRYVSTRSDESASFREILLEGLAADGGLFLPERYPRLDDATLDSWRDTLASDGYAALCARVIAVFVDDISEIDLRGLCERAYDAESFPSVVSVSRLDERIWLGHVSAGPTAAFKDMAMQLLGELFEFELDARGTTMTVLGATSGDTGSSAEYALRGRDNVEVFMLTPAGRMSQFQRAQMYGLTDPNIHNIAVDGVFDDCQDIVKAVNADARFKAEFRIGAVNSINWARVLAQVCYYVALWLMMTRSNGERVSFAVPTGNFGNICAGHVAREMGIGIDRLVCATNENNVLHEFFTTGRYRPRAGSEVAATSSPSMDISKASNFERFCFDLLGRDTQRVAKIFGESIPGGEPVDLSRDPAFAQVIERYGFISGSSTHADRIATIRDCYRHHGALIDPHTADGVTVARRLAGEFDGPIVALETALPVKFAETIREAIGTVPELPERFAHIMDAPSRYVDMANDADACKAYIREVLG